VGVLLVTAGSSTCRWRHRCGSWFFAVLGGAIMGALGMIAGIWADKFDQLAAFQNFLIMPLTLLSGVFYSIHSLPPFWQQVSHFNPFFYMIDGFRYGFFGVSDVRRRPAWRRRRAAFAALSLFTCALLRIGYKLRA
jgi:ABC-2 type transport system permease protein